MENMGLRLIGLILIISCILGFFYTLIIAMPTLYIITALPLGVMFLFNLSIYPTNKNAEEKYKDFATYSSILGFNGYFWFFLIATFKYWDARVNWYNYLSSSYLDVYLIAIIIALVLGFISLFLMLVALKHGVKTRYSITFSFYSVFVGIFALVFAIIFSNVPVF